MEITEKLYLDLKIIKLLLVQKIINKQTLKYSNKNPGLKIIDTYSVSKMAPNG